MAPRRTEMSPHDKGKILAYMEIFNATQIAKKMGRDPTTIRCYTRKLTLYLVRLILYVSATHSQDANRKSMEPTSDILSFLFNILITFLHHIHRIELGSQTCIHIPLSNITFDILLLKRLFSQTFLNFHTLVLY